MNDTDKRINSIIESEDEDIFNNRTYTGKTRRLMLKILHLTAREDMVYYAYGGKCEIDHELMKVVEEYRKSVRADMNSLVEGVNN